MRIEKIGGANSSFLERARKIKQRINYKVACHLVGYCPTSKEIENDAIKNLTKRLEGASKKETLTNILEWQDGNINFWDERYPIPIVLLISTIVVFPLLFAFGACLALFSILIFNSWLLSSIILIWVSAFVSNIVTTIVIIIVLIKSNRRIPLKDGLFNAFKPSISMNMLLRRERKLGICRDYAKLSACLLSNIDKNPEIFFLHSKGHVAAGIKVGEERYMLDQHLPVLTINQWYKREHGSAKPSKILFLYRTAHKLNDNLLESIPIDTLLSKTETRRLNSPQELASEMSKLLNIPNDEIGNPKDDVLSIKLPKWAKGANLYAMNDEIVNYSLARWLKKKISNELIESTQITNIEIKKENADLIFQISFKSKE
jgi:predicted transglutaminase-like protease